MFGLERNRLLTDPEGCQDRSNCLLTNVEVMFVQSVVPLSIYKVQ